MNSNIPVVFPFHVFVSSVSLQPSSDAPTTSQVSKELQVSVLFSISHLIASAVLLYRFIFSILSHLLKKEKLLLLYPQYQKSQRDGGGRKVLLKLDCAVSCLSRTAEELQRPSWRWKTHCAAVPAALFKSISVWVWVWEGGANGKKLNHRSKHS